MKTTFNTLGHFFRPLKESWKFSFLFFFGILLIFPLVILSILSLISGSKEFKEDFCNLNAPFDLKFLLAIWISIIGIYVSIRIYFELRDKAHTLNDFIRIVYDIVNKASVDNQVYVVLPTAFIGYLLYMKGKNNGYTKFERKLCNLNKLKLAFLSTNIDSLPIIDESKIDDDEIIEKMASFFTTLKEDNTEENLLMHFHNNEFGDGKNKSLKYRYFAHLFNFLKAIKSCQESKGQAIDVINQDKVDGEFVVLVANVDKKECFIGVVNVLSQLDVDYSGERIVSENLSKIIEILYNSFTVQNSLDNGASIN